MTSCDLSRRGFLRISCAFAASGLLPRTALAGGRDPRFLLVVLRGALDGLAAGPPLGDPSYASLRGDLAVPASGEGAALALDGVFGLNPSMTTLKALFDGKEALIAHAVATPYRGRSHFDGQDLLENGTPSAFGAGTGWLNRAAAALPSVAPARGRRLFAVGATVPLVMRGPSPVVTWTQRNMADVDADTRMRVARLYRHRDPRLLAALEEGERLSADLSGGMKATPGGRGDQKAFSTAAAAAGRALAQPDGPRIAALAFDGWDTHFNEGTRGGRLADLLGALDGAFGALREALGPVWRDTAIVVATEFGRTAHANGTNGTDHGTAAAAFLAGGAVRGGRVLADWPGLSGRALHEGRDLAPTTDLRSLLKGVLRDHLGFPDGVLARDVFPGSENVRATSDLIAA